MHYMVFDHCLLNDSLSTIQSEPFVKYNKDKLSSNTYVRFWLTICNRICKIKTTQDVKRIASLYLLTSVCVTKCQVALVNSHLL